MSIVTRFTIGSLESRAATLRDKGYRTWRAYLPVWIGPARMHGGPRDGHINGIYLRCWPFRHALLICHRPANHDSQD